MSHYRCGCGSVIVYPPCPQVECPDVNPVALSNANLAGEGVLDSFVGQTGEFRGITGDGTWISVTLNAPNKAIVISFDDTNIAAAVPQATEAVSGIAEIATQAEMDAGLDDTKVTSALKFRTTAATTTQIGTLRFATQAEVNAGFQTSTAVSPATFITRVNTIKATTTFANAAARAAATPAFDGQVGVQLDTEMVYTATGLAAGNWQSSFMQPNTTTNFTADTEFALDGNAFVVSDGAVEHIRIDASGEMSFGAPVRFLATASVNFITGSTILVNSVTVPANSVLITSSTAGRPSSKLISEFVSTSNTQTGWGTPTGNLSRLTYGTYDGQVISNPPTQGEVQSMDDAIVDVSQRLAALITDLKLVKLPAT